MTDRAAIEKQIIVLEAQLAHLRLCLNKNFDSVETFYEDEEVTIQREEFLLILKQKHDLEWLIKTKKERYAYRIYCLKLAEKFNNDHSNERKIQFMKNYIAYLKYTEKKLNNKKLNNKMSAILRDIYEQLDNEPFIDLKKANLPDNFFTIKSSKLK